MSHILDLNNRKLKNGNQQISSVFEDSNITLVSFSNDLFVIDNQPVSRDNHYIKHLKLNPNGNHITSLKRRIRKYQSKQDLNQETITFQFPTLISYPQQAMSSCYYRTKKSSRVVPLLSLIHNNKTAGTRIHDININRYVF